ncbi:MAG: YncE family protein [Anaerolineae bacterium]
MKRFLFALGGALALAFLLFFSPAWAVAPLPAPVSTTPVTLLATVPIGDWAGPKGVTVNEATGDVYVALFGNPVASNGQEVARIQEPAHALMTEAWSGGIHPNQLFYSRSTNRLYVTNRDTNNVAFLNADTLDYMGQLPATAQGNGMPWGIAGSPTDNAFYVAAFNTGAITLVDGVYGSPPMTFNTPNDRPALAAYHRNSDRVFITGWNSGKLYVIDIYRHIYYPAFTPGANAFGVAVSALGTVYVDYPFTRQIFYADGTLAHPDQMQFTQLTQLPAGKLGAMALNDATNHLLVVAQTDASQVLYVVDRRNGALLQTLPLGNPDEDEGGQGIALNTINGVVYVTNYHDGTVYILQDAVPADVHMTGHVYNTSPGNNYDIPGVVAAISFPCDPYTAQTTTDAGGHFAITVPGDPLNRCGQVHLSLTKAGYMPGGNDITEDYLRAYPDWQFGMAELPPNTDTPTVTLTPTATNTPTLTRTPTATPTRTGTPTATRTRSPTATGTNTPAPPPTAVTAVPPNTPFIIANISLGAHPKGVALREGDTRVFVALYDTNQVAVVDGPGLQVLGTHGTGGAHPNQVLYDGGTNGVFITNRDSNRVTGFDADTWTPLLNVTTDRLPWGLGIRWPNAVLYTANFGAGDVTAFDATGTRIQTLALAGDQPTLLAVTSGKLYTPGWLKGNLYVIDSANAVSNPISVGAGAFGVAANPYKDRIYLTNRTTHKLYIVDALQDNVRQVVTLANAGYHLAVNPTTNHVWVVMAAVNRVVALDGTTGAVLKTLPVGAQDASEGGQGIAVDHLTNRVYVSNYAAGTLTVIQDVASPLPTPAVSRICTAPLPASRPNGWVSPTRQVILDWTDPDCAPTFDLQVRQGTTTGALAYSHTGLTLSKDTTVALTPGKTYFWHARACNSSGACSGWSAWWKFTLSATAR